MEKPDQRLFEADLQSAEFRIGVANGQWGLAEQDKIPPDAAWPNVYIWIAAASRPNAPDRFYIRLNAAGYRSVPPTSSFWDPEKKAPVELARWPKGKPDSRFAKVFRTDTWQNGKGDGAFYHPYDRVPVADHPGWTSAVPKWTDKTTIVNYLEEFHALFRSGDYVGV